jgi:hypothetical protein
MSTGGKLMSLKKIKITACYRIGWTLGKTLVRGKPKSKPLTLRVVKYIIRESSEWLKCEDIFCERKRLAFFLWLQNENRSAKVLMNVNSGNCKHRIFCTWLRGDAFLDVQNLWRHSHFQENIFVLWLFGGRSKTLRSGKEPLVLWPCFSRQGWETPVKRRSGCPSRTKKQQGIWGPKLRSLKLHTEL